MPDLAIENGVVKLSVALTNLPEIDAKFDSFIADLQKKCNLKLTIDSTALDASSAAIASKIARVATATTRATSKTSKDFDDRRLNSFFNAQQRMALRLRDMGTTTAEYDRFVRLLNDVKANGGKGFEKLASASIEAQHSVQALNKELKETQSFERNRAQLASKLTDGWFASESAKLNSSYASADPTLVQSAKAKLQEIKNLGDVSTMTRDQLDGLNAKIAEYNNIVSQIGKTNSATRSFEDQATALANLKAQYEDYMSKYGQNLQRNLPLLEKFRQFGTALSSGSLTSNAAAQQFAALREEAKKSGIEIETVRQRMTNLFGQHFNTALIMLAIRGLRQALRQLWQDIKEVNEALVQTQIVTGLSGAALEAYTDKAYAAAEKSRDKVTNILSESTAYGRLGYDSELSVQLAQLTSMYSKLGDVDTSDATDAITALMKAFDLKNADEIELALDKMIYVGNNFPISAAGLGEGLNNAASALSSAGNSLEQTLALLMAANATVQNPSKSSTAMRTITARIRNTKAELDELGEELDEKYNTVAKYQKELLGLTGVDILDATGKNFRATYDILKDLAGVWSTLSSAQQAAVTTMLAGTRNQDIFASLMKNFPSAEDAMSGMDDAAGLMDEKFKAVEGSIGGALSGLSNAWSKFSNTLLNSNDVVNFIDALTGLVNILERLTKVTGGGAFITGTLALITFFRAFRQFGQIYPQMQATMSALQGVYTGTGSILNASQLQTVTQALSGFTNAQQRAIMTSLGFPTAAQAQVLSMQNMSTAGLTAGGAMSTLGASIDGLKTKMTAFVQSGNVWITIIMLLAQVVLGIVNMVRQNSEAAEQAVEAAKQAEIDAMRARTNAIRSTKSAISEFDNGENSIDRYIERLEQAEEGLKNAEVGSQAYKDANLELYSVQKDIVNIFGEESGVIRGVNEDLKDYAVRLNDVAKRKQYNDLFTGSNYSGTAAALSLFGITPEGKTKQTQTTIQLDNVSIVSDSYQTDTWLGRFGYAYGRDEATERVILRLFGDDIVDSFEKTIIEHVVDPNVTRELFGPQGLERVGFRSDTWTDRVTIDSITFTGTAKQVVDRLMSQVDYFRSIGDSASATIVSNVLNQYKESIGYDDAMQIFQTWASGRILYGEAQTDLGRPYYDLLATKTAYEDSLASGDTQAVRTYLLQYLDLLDGFVALANDKGYDWAAQFAQGMVSGLDNVDLVRDILSGKLRTNILSPTGDVYQGFYASSLFADPRALEVLDTLKAMSAGGSVELWNRQKIPAAKMQAAGYDVPDGSYSTVDSFTFSNEDETVWMNFTPILPNGEVLTRESFEEYCWAVVNGAEDTLGLKIGTAYSSVDDAVDAAVAAHDASAEWYDAALYNRTEDLIGENILAASIFKSREEAAEHGMLREYAAYTRLASAAELYGTTIEHLLTLLSRYYGLQMSATAQGSYTYSTFHNNAGSGLNVKDPFTNESVLGATGSVASVKEAGDKLFNAEAARDRIKEAFDSGAEIAQEDIDEIKEYVGDTFDEIDEDVLASIDETLDESRDEVSTSIEGLANSAIEWMQENVEGFNLADYIDTEGNIDFSGIIAAFQNSGVENAAGAAGANASMSYLSQLQTVGGASIRAKLDADGLGYTTEFNGGTGSSDTTKKKSGGGGGGHHSQISDDIENIDRMIDLFRKLLNYYTEGSDQWIARQTQLIDKYKAGVEIAMNEYERLRAKGLKETDEDVKKLVDTILEYQDSIYEESEKLWEAVRQNQIDSLKHLKGQNDAAIELEKTHHDLLIAIRDERRELEDELKAARDAYSEVMTPEELDAMFSVEDYAELMDKLAGIEGDAMALYRDYKEQIAAVSEDETYMIEHITDEFKRQYDLKMKEYEIAKAELGVARAQQELENVKNEQTVMMLIGGRWQWVADPEKVLEAEQKLADAEQELADAQDEYDFQSLIHEMEAQSSAYQKQIDALEALTFSMDELAEQIHLFSDSVYKELLTYLSQIAQATFDKYAGDTAVPAFAEGGVIRRGGLAMVHSGEPIFSTADAERLWRFVHDLGDTPINVSGVYAGLTRKLVDAESPVFGNTSAVSIDNSINIPGGIHVHGETAQQLITLLKEVVAPYQPNA